MKKFIKEIQKKDEAINGFLEDREIALLEDVLIDLEEQHKEIKKNLKEVNYLLELIDKHNVEGDSNSQEREENRNSWLQKIKGTLEKLHLTDNEKLTKEDIELLQKEKAKLQKEKALLEKEHTHVHQLIAKAKIHLWELEDEVVKDLTKGYDLVQTGEKLLEKFGKIAFKETSYEYGRKEIIDYLEEVFCINRVEANKLFELLEKNKVVEFDPNLSTITEFPDYSDIGVASEFGYLPVFGTWYIKE